VKFWEKRKEKKKHACDLQLIYIFKKFFGFFFFFFFFFAWVTKTKCEEEFGQSKNKFHQEELGK
jgi:hypothetical protein